MAAAKYSGFSTWCWFDTNGVGGCTRSPVIRAVVRENGTEIAMDCDNAVPGTPAEIYAISLRMNGGSHHTGTWKTGKGLAPNSGTCEGDVFSNQSGYVLIGTWTEDGSEHVWYVHLSKEQ